MLEQIDMGTPSSIIWHGISKLCTQFHAFITLVTIRSSSHLTISVN